MVVNTACELNRRSGNGYFNECTVTKHGYALPTHAVARSVVCSVLFAQPL